MKKFTKICLIIAAVLAGLGIIFCGISYAAGGSLYANLKRGVNYGKWHIGTHGIYYGENGNYAGWYGGDDGDYFYEADGKNTTKAIENGNTADNENTAETVEGMQNNTEMIDEYFETDAGKIKNIKFHVGAANVDIKTSPAEDKIIVAYKNVYPNEFSCIANEDTMEIRYRYEEAGRIRHQTHHRKQPKILVQIPENKAFETMDFQIGAGNVFVEHPNLTCETLSVNVDAGNVEAENFSVSGTTKLNVDAGTVELGGTYGDMKLECNAGTVELGGKVNGDLSAMCNVGSVELDLEGKETDYNYEVECSMGEIELNGKEYTSISGKQKMENAGAEKTMSLNCSMGEIEVNVE